MARSPRRPERRSSSRHGASGSPAATPARRGCHVSAGRALCLVAWLLGLALSPACGAAAGSTKLLFVGVDGATWKVIGPLVDEGALPTFARLLRDGAHAPDFDTLETTASPLIWTTMVTGRAPRDHGIDSFTTDLPNGSRVPIASSNRTARALWEVANRRDLSAGVIGLWATWPAEEIDGYVISDHANAAFSEFLVSDGRLWVGADPVRLRQLRRDFYPLDLAPVLERHWIDRDAFPYEDIERRTGYSSAQMQQLRQAEWNVFDDPYSLLKTMLRVDLPLFRVAGTLLRERPTDLQILYLHGPDPIQHLAWDLVEPAAYAVPNPHLARDRGLVEGVYRAVDSMLGELLSLVGPDCWVVVASDHGAEPAPAATGNPRSGRPGEHTYAAKGVLFLSGPHVKRGVRVREATPYDLMPTFLWLLDLPLSAELEGRILSEAFDPAFVAARPPRTVPSYGPREVSRPEASPADRLMLELLQSLGYVGG